MLETFAAGKSRTWKARLGNWRSGDAIRTSHALRHLLLVGVLLNLLMRLQLVMLFSQYPIQAKAPGSDESGYVNLGLHFFSWLISGNAVRLPLYPAFLSLFVGNGLPEWLIYVVQNAVFVAAASAICCAVFDSVLMRLGMLNALLFYGPFMTGPNGALSETFTASVLLLALAVFVKQNEPGSKSSYIAAFLFGLVGLSRPNFLTLFPLILAALFLTGRVAWRQLLAYVLLLLLPIVLWMSRNYVIQGEWIYNTTGGENIYYASRVVPPDCKDELRCLDDLFGDKRPENLRVSRDNFWMWNRYFDNTDIYQPIKSGYRWKNDLQADREYLGLAAENYIYILKNNPRAVLYKILDWFRKYQITSEATYEYTWYRNYGGVNISSDLLSALQRVAGWYDVLLFSTGIFLLFVFGFAVLVLPRLRDHASMTWYAVLFFSLITPIPVSVGGRFTMIHLLLLIPASGYLLYAHSGNRIRLLRTSDSKILVPS